MTATKKLVVSALIGACYATLTIVLAPISYGAVQFRVSEALTVLPFVIPSSAWGLFVGCFIANLFSPTASILDIVFGSLATLLAGCITAIVKNKWLAPLPPVIINAAVVGAIIAYTSAPNAALIAFPTIALSVAIGELTVCYTLGMSLLFALLKVKAQNPNNLNL